MEAVDLLLDLVAEIAPSLELAEDMASAVVSAAHPMESREPLVLALRLLPS